MPIAIVRKPEEPTVYVFAIIDDDTAVVSYDDVDAPRVNASLEDLV